MQVKAWAQEVRAFKSFRSADGTDGLTALIAGIQFKNGLYVGGTFSAAALPITTNNITINGMAGSGYIQYAAQASNPSLALVHTFADSGGHFAIAQSGSSGSAIRFENSLLTADRLYTFQNKSGTLAMTDDNVSQFSNNARYIVGPAGAVSGNVPTFNGVTGFLAQDSGIAIGSVVLNTRTLTEGAGLAGNTYDLSANRTLAMGTPSTLSIASTNAASGTTHSHLITSSSNPGSAASILSTDLSGFLTLRRLTVTDYAFVNASTANFYLKDTSTGFQAATSGIVTLQSGNALRSSPSFVSGVTGWNETAAGDAEFNNVRIRGELAASVFKVSEISATAGTLGVFYSASTVYSDCLTAATVGGAMAFIATNSDAGGMLFAVGDVVRLKSWTGAAISDAWVTITSRTNNGTNTTYNGNLSNGSTSTIFRAGTAIVDYGPSGTGFITLSADGTVGSSPNLTMATHAGSPWSAQTNLLRLGNLNGSYGYATDVYGLGIGQYGTASRSWQTLDQTNGLRIGNNAATLAQWDVSGNIQFFDASGNSLMQFDTSGNARFGRVAANRANVYWNASNSRLEFRGNTTVQSYIDTDGSFVAGAGAVSVNANGILIDSVPVSSVKAVNWGSGEVISASVFGNWGGTAPNSSFAVLESDLPSISSGVAAFTFLTAKNNLGVSGDFWITTKGSTSTNANKSYANFFGGSTLGFVIGSGAVPAHMLDVYGAGWFQTGVQLPASTGSQIAADSSNNTLLSLAVNATATPFSGTSNFYLGGIFVITGSAVSGDTAIIMAGGGVLTIVSQTAAGFSLTAGNAGTVNLYYAAGNVLTVENKRAGTETLNIFAIKTR